MFPTVPPPPQRLLVFARLPEKGRVKTRLAESLGAERALAVYEAMLRDVLASVGTPSPETDIEVMWAPTPAASGEHLRAAFGDLPLAMQTGETLGDRLAMAFSERFFFHRTQKIVAVGVDEPCLKRELVDHAFALLDGCEWVIGPALDGGYYLIGCRAPAFDPDIFQGISWGGPDVLQATLDKIRAWRASVAVLPRRYDIDLPEDLRRFAASADESSHLGRLLTEWGERS